MPDLSDPAVLKLAHKVLARTEYSGLAKPDTIADWERRIIEWLLKLQFLHDRNPVEYWLIFAAVVAVVVALFAHLAWTVWIATHTAAPAESRIEVAAPPNLAADAARFAAEGHYLDAAHRLMLASFRALAERSVIELRPDRSNRWIRNALRKSALDRDIAAELDDLVERTERRWFGDRTNDPAIYEQWRTAFTRLSSAR